MIKKCLLLAGFVSCLFSVAQVPVVPLKSWQAEAGGLINFPLIGSYDDFNVTKGSDYFWQYDARTASSFGYSARFYLLRRIHDKKTAAFFSYGGGYRLKSTAISYSGWEGGGASGIMIRGAGEKKWDHHYIDLSAGITHQFYFGRKKRVILNGISFRAAFMFYETEEKSFSGTSDFQGQVILNDAGYVRSGFSENSLLPFTGLEFSSGIVLAGKKVNLVPGIRLPFLDLSPYYMRSQGVKETLGLRKEYFKDVLLSFSIIPLSL